MRLFNKIESRFAKARQRSWRVDLFIRWIV